MKRFSIVVKVFFHVVIIIWFLPPFCQYLVNDEPGIAFFVLWLFFACMVGFFLGYSKKDEDGGEAREQKRGLWR